MNPAITALHDAYTAAPSRSTLLPLLQAYRGAGHHDEVEALLLACKSQFGNQNWWQLQMAKTHLAHHRLLPAASILRALKTSTPDNWDIHVTLSTCLRRRAKHDDLRELWAHTPVSPPPPYAQMELGRYYDLSENYINAIAAYDSVPDQAGPAYAARIEAARCRYKAGQHEAALEALEHLRAAHPDSPQEVRLLSLMATICQRTHRLERAIKAAHEALAIQPEHAQALTILARALLSQGQTEEALAYAERLIALQPQQVEPILMAARGLERLGRHEEAISRLRTHAAYELGNTRLLFIEARLLLHQGRTDAAGQSIEQALVQAKPGEAASLHLLEVDRLVKMRRRSEAIAHLQDQQANYPADGRFIKKEIALHFAEQEYTTLMHRYSVLVAPSAGLDPDTELRYAIALWHTGHGSQAEDVIGGLPSLSSHTSHMLLAQFYRHIGDLDRAVAAYRTVVTGHYDHHQRSAALCRLVETYLQDDHLEQASQTLKQHTELHGAAEVIRCRAKLALASGNPKEAMVMLSRGMAQYPDHMGLLTDMARRLHEAGDQTGAKSLLDSIDASQWTDGMQDLYAAIGNRLYDMDTGMKLYRAAYRQRQDDPRFMGRMLDALLRHHLFVDARLFVRKHEDVLRSHPRGIMALCRYHLVTGGVKRAAVMVDGALEAQPPSFALSEIKVQALAQQSDWAAVSELLPKMHPTSARQRQFIAHRQMMCHMVETRFDEALDVLEQLYAQQAMAQNGYMDFAMLQTLTGDVDGSHKTLVSASRAMAHRTPGTPVVIPLQSRVGKLNNALRSHPTALGTWKEAMAIHSVDQRLYALAALTMNHQDYVGGYLWLMITARQSDHWARLSTEASAPDLIPRHIIQYWDRRAIPSALNQMASSWYSAEGFTYDRYDARRALHYIASHYTAAHTTAFKNCRHPAEQADYFRLAYLLREGGIYADIDDYRHGDLAELIKVRTFIAHQEHLGSVGNNFLAVRPGHPWIEAALDKATRRLNGYANEPAWFKVGPLLLTSVVAQHLAQSIIADHDVNDVRGAHIISIQDLSNYVWCHQRLPYKHTPRNWYRQQYVRERRRQSASS